MSIKTAASVILFIFGVWIMPSITPAQTMRVLDNGLRVIHKQNSNNNIVSAICFIDTGSIFEPENKKGITSFIQQVIVKGTDQRTAEEIAIETESLGISLSTDATDDYAYASVKCIADDSAKAFDIFTDVLFSPSFPSEEVEKEREHILMNMRLSEDDSFYYTYKHFRNDIFSGHPYATMPEGTPESIRQITRDDLIKTHSEAFVPANMVLSVVGNISESKLMKLVKKHFAGRTGAMPPKFHVSKNFTPQYKKQILHKEVEQSMVIMGFLAPEVTKNDYPSLKVAASVLGDGMSSRLFRHLRDDQGLAYAVGTSLPARRDQSAILGYIGTKAKSAQHATEEMILQFRRLMDERVGEEELQRTKNHILGRYMMDHQRNSRQAWYMGWFELMGLGWQYDEKYPEVIEQVSPDDILKAANKYFTEPVIVQLMPEKEYP